MGEQIFAFRVYLLGQKESSVKISFKSKGIQIVDEERKDLEIRTAGQKKNLQMA